MSPMPAPAPLYTAANCSPAFQLNWSLAAFWTAPMLPAADWLPSLRAATEPDGVRVLEHHCKQPTTSQFLLSTTPAVAPQQIIRSVKGRLQYLVRHQLPQAFRRNY